MYLPAFPKITQDLHAPKGTVQFSLSIFLLGAALGQLFYGPISDRVGRRIPLLFGIALFAFAAIGCALVATAPQLIAWRLVMALGGSAGMVLSRAIIRDTFGAREAADAFSLVMIAMGAAPILAPILGGQLLLLGSWRHIFVVLAAIGVLAWVSVCFGLPESRPPQRRTAGNIAETLSGYVRLLANRHFLGFSLVLGFNAGAMFTYITCSSHVFIEIYHVSPMEFTLFFGVNSLGLLGAAALNRRLLHHYSPAQILRIVLFLVFLAGAGLAIVAKTGTGGFPALTVLLFLTLASNGMVGPNATALALAPFGRGAGGASALLGTVQFSTGGLAGAVAGRLGETSAVPMCCTLTGCALAAMLAFHALAKTDEIKR
jgi:DHA1 family bicyclomycin/chloramphenicol resistance-like MFS transporter